MSSSPAPAASKVCEHCHTAKAQAKVTFAGVTLKLCKPCLEIEQKRVHLARLCERCAQGKQVAKVTVGGVTLKLCEACVQAERVRLEQKGIATTTVSQRTPAKEAPTTKEPLPPATPPAQQTQSQPQQQSHYDSVPPEIGQRRPAELVSTAGANSQRRVNATPSTPMHASHDPAATPLPAKLEKASSANDDKTLRKLCESCRERKAVKRAALSDGSMIKLCFECLADIGAPKSPGAAAVAAAVDLAASPPPAGFNPAQRRATTASVKLASEASITANFHTPAASPVLNPGKRYTPPPVADPNAAAGAGSTAYVAKYPFKATSKGQLTFAKGDVFKIYNQDKPEWWKALNGAGVKGWVPAKYLAPANADQAAQFDTALKAALRGAASSASARILESPSAADTPHGAGPVSPRRVMSPLAANHERDSDIIAVEGLHDALPDASPIVGGPRRPPTPPDDDHADLPPQPSDDEHDDDELPQPPPDNDSSGDRDSAHAQPISDDDEQPPVPTDADDESSSLSSGVAASAAAAASPRAETRSPGIDTAAAAAAEKRAADQAAEKRAADQAAEKRAADQRAAAEKRAADLAAEKRAAEVAAAEKRAAEAAAQKRADELAAAAAAEKRAADLAAAEKRAADLAVAAERRAAELAAAADRAAAKERMEAAERRAQQLARDADAALERERQAAQRAREEAQAEKERAEKAEALLRERERALEERERTLRLERAEAERLAAEAQKEAQARAEAERKAAEATEQAKEAERIAREAREAKDAEAAKKKAAKRAEKDTVKRKAKAAAAAAGKSRERTSSSSNPLRAFAAVRMSTELVAAEEARACSKRSGAAMCETETRFERPEDAGQWIDFLDQEVTSRFPGGLTLRKEPDSRRRCRVYLALPARDIEKVREVEQLFHERFPKRKEARTALRNVFLLPRQSPSLLTEARAQREVLAQHFRTVPDLYFEAHMYVALQWKRNKQMVPIDEPVIQACFRDVLSPEWAETQLLRCYGQRLAKDQIKRLNTSAIVVLRARATEANIEQLNKLIEECAEQWEQPAILTMAFVMAPGDTRSPDGGVFDRPPESMMQWRKPDKQTPASPSADGSVQMFDDDDDDLASDDDDDEASDEPPTSARGAGGGAGGRAAATAAAAAADEDEFDKRIKADNDVERKASEAAKAAPAAISPEWVPVLERLMRDVQTLPHATLQRIRLKDPEQELDMLKTLGHGAMGTVWRVRHRGTGVEYAVKQLEVKRQPQVADVKAEIAVMRDLDFPHLVRYVDHVYVSSTKHMWIALELAERGSITTILDSREPRGLPERGIKPVCLSIVRGLAYLHARGIMHRDVKPENVLVNKHGVVKLGDFGISRQMNEAAQKTKTLVGTPQYLSPEVVTAGDAGYGVKVDVWGLGMCCKEMAEGMPLFHDLTPMQALFRLAEPDFTAGLDNPASFSIEFSLFVGMCLKSRPEERASSAQLLDHIFVDEVDPLLPSDL